MKIAINNSLLSRTTKTIQFIPWPRSARLTSFSSRSSIETYGSLRDEITDIEQSPVALSELFRDAEKIIIETFAPTLNAPIHSERMTRSYP